MNTEVRREGKDLIVLFEDHRMEAYAIFSNHEAQKLIRQLKRFLKISDVTDSNEKLDKH